MRARHDYKAVQAHGRRVTTTFMTLLAQPNELNRDRLGIIASRRLGGAVVRNRAKRRIREIFRRHMAAADARAVPARTLDLVVIPRRELIAAPFTVLQTDFENGVRRLRVRR